MTAQLKSLLSFEQKGGFFTCQGDWVPSTSFKVISCSASKRTLIELVTCFVSMQDISPSDKYMKIPQGRTREQSRAAAAAAPAGKSLTSPESKHAGLTEDKHADAEKLMLNLTDVKRMCGSQPDDIGDWGVEFVEVRHHPHYDMPTPSTYGHAAFCLRSSNSATRNSLSSFTRVEGRSGGPLLFMHD